MPVYLYNGGQRFALNDPQAYVGPVKTPVQTIWAYDAGQRHLVWSRNPATMTATSDRWDRVALSWTAPGPGADSYRVKRNGTQVYSGANLSFTDTGLLPNTAYAYALEALRSAAVVGQASATITTSDLSMRPMTGAAASTSAINLSWANPGGIDVVRLRDSAGGVQDLAGSATSGSRTGLAASTAYNFALDAIRGGSIVKSNAASVDGVRTGDPVYQQKTVDCGVVYAASYNGSGKRRTDTNGVASCYYGYWDSTWGQQKSLVRFNIPNEVRGCHSVDAVQLRWWNKHHNFNSGGRVSMVGHHNTDINASGSTGAMFQGADQVRWPAPKPGWINGTEWYHVGWLTATPFNRTMAEEIRVGGLQGFGLVGAYGGRDGYGYGSTDPILRLTYTVRVA